MVNKSKIFLFIILGTLTCFGGAHDTIKRLRHFVGCIFCNAINKNDLDQFKKLLKESDWIYTQINLPKDLEHDISTLLTLEKPGVLSLFGINGETLFNYLIVLTNFLNAHMEHKTIGKFRKYYLSKLTNSRDLSCYPHLDLQLLPEILEFGKKNGFKFEPEQLDNYLILNRLEPAFGFLPKEIASRIVSSLSHLVNAQDSWGYTPLMEAYDKPLVLAELLINHKANLEVKSIKTYEIIPTGSTALHICASNNNWDLTKLLLESGADYDTETDDQTRAIDLIDEETLEGFLKKRREVANSVLHEELPQVLVNIVCQYLADESKKQNE